MFSQQPPREVFVERDKPVWPWLLGVFVAVVVFGVFLGNLFSGTFDDPVTRDSSNAATARTTSSTSSVPTTTPPVASSSAPTATTPTSSPTVPPTQAPTTTVAPAPTTTQAPPPPAPARTTTASYTYCNYNASNGIVVMVSPTQSATLFMASGVPVPDASSAGSNYTFEVDPSNPSVAYGFSAQPASASWTCEQYAYGGDWILPAP